MKKFNLFFNIFFILFCLIGSIIFSKLNLLSVFILSCYSIMLIKYLIMKEWRLMQYSIFIIIEIIILRKYFNCEGLFLILIVFILPVLRKANFKRIFVISKKLIVSYFKFLDRISINYVDKMFKKK